MQSLLIAFLFWIVSCTPSYAISLGATAVHGPFSSGQIVLSYTGTTAGNGLLVQCMWNNDGTAGYDWVTKTVSGESDLTLQASTLAHNVTLGYTSQIGILSKLTSGGTKTITLAFHVNVVAAYCHAQELVGGTNGIQTAGAQTASGNGTNPTMTLTTSINNAAIFFRVLSDTSNPTPGANYTTHTTMNWYVPFDRNYYDLNVGSSGAITVDTTDSNIQQYVMNGLAVADDNSGGGGGGGNVSSKRIY